MRLIPSFALVVLAASAFTQARADEMFTITGEGITITFNLPKSPTPDFYQRSSSPGGDFYFYNVPLRQDGSGIGDWDVVFQDYEGGQGLYMTTDYYHALVDVDGSGLFTGDISAPTFNEGSYTMISNPFNPGPEYSGTFNLTIAPSQVTPEPSSFALLGTGLLGVAGVMKKRFC